MAIDIATVHAGDSSTAEEKIQQLRGLFADAPEVGKTALERVLQQLTSQASDTPPQPVECRPCRRRPRHALRIPGQRHEDALRHGL